MAKLYFKYGTVNSAKTMNLLATAYNYTSCGKKVFLIKPKIDIRFGENIVKSRVGSERKADLVIDSTQSILGDFENWIDSDIILVDEAQFLTEKQIENLWQITCNFEIDVICYGLRADFRQQLFPASKRLLELSDNILDISSTCYRCNRVAIHNLRIDKCGDGEANFEGPSVEISLDRFVGVCSKCYFKATKKIKVKKDG